MFAVAQSTFQNNSRQGMEKDGKKFQGKLYRATPLLSVQAEHQGQQKFPSSASPAWPNTLSVNKSFFLLAFICVCIAKEMLLGGILRKLMNFEF